MKRGRKRKECTESNASSLLPSKRLARVSCNDISDSSVVPDSEGTAEVKQEPDESIFDDDCRLLSDAFRFCKDEPVAATDEDLTLLAGLGDDDSVDGQSSEASAGSGEDCLESTENDELDEICLDGDVSCLARMLRQTRRQPKIEACESLENLSAMDANALLMINERYQSAIAIRLDQIKLLLAEMRQKKRLLDKEHSRLLRKKVYRLYPISRKPCFPFFQDSAGLGPELLPEVADASRDCVSIAGTTRIPRLSSEDAQKVYSNVVWQIREALSDRRQIRSHAGISDVAPAASDQSGRVDEMPDEELVRNPEYLRLINWSAVASELDWPCDRFWCKAVWSNYLDPSINKANWKADETKRLFEIVSKQAKGWDQVASLLGTKRSAYMCMKRYMEKENIRDMHYLSNHDVNLMDSVVAENRIGFHIFWNNVSYKLQKRSPSALFAIYRTRECRFSQDTWTPEEIQVLLKCANKANQGLASWIDIARRLPGRCMLECVRKYFSMCRQQLTDPSVIKSILQWYDSVKLPDQPMVKNDTGFNPYIQCVLKSCSHNEVVYKWLRAQRPCMRALLLTFYKNPDFKGGVATPNGQLVYMEPIVKLRGRDMGVLGSDLAQRVAENIMGMQDKGAYPVLPTLATFIRIIRQSKSEEETIERIQDTNLAAESLSSQKHTWKLRNLKLTGPTRKDRVEYVHCFAGACYMRVHAPVESEACEVLDDLITSIDLFDSLASGEPPSDLLHQMSAMLTVLEEFMLIGIVHGGSLFKLCDVSRLLIQTVNHGNTALSTHPLILLAAYIWTAVQTAKQCCLQHVMTARYVMTYYQDMPCYKRFAYKDDSCFVCSKFGEMMHVKTSQYQVNYSNLVNIYLPFSATQSVSTSVRQLMVKIHNHMAQIPKRIINPPTARPLGCHDKVVVARCMKALMDRVVAEVDSTRIKRFRKAKVNKRYLSKIVSSADSIFPRPCKTADSLCATAKGRALIREVTDRMNADGCTIVWKRAHTRTVYSVLCDISVRVSYLLMQRSSTRRKATTGVVRQSARLAATEPKGPSAPPNVSRPQRKKRVRRPAKQRAGHKKVGRKPKVDPSAPGKSSAKRPELKRILANADYAYNLGQTEKFAFCASKLSLNIGKQLQTFTGMLPNRKLVCSHLAKRMTLANTLCTTKAFEKSLTADEVQHFDDACRRCLSSLISPSFADEMLDAYCSLLGTRQLTFTSHTPESLIDRATTRRSVKSKIELAHLNFNTQYWYFVQWQWLDISTYQQLRDRVRTLLRKPLKALLEASRDGLDSEAARLEANLARIRSRIIENINSTIEFYGK